MPTKKESIHKFLITFWYVELLYVCYHYLYKNVVRTTYFHSHLSYD